MEVLRIVNHVGSTPQATGRKCRPKLRPGGLSYLLYVCQLPSKLPRLAQGREAVFSQRMTLAISDMWQDHLN